MDRQMNQHHISKDKSPSTLSSIFKWLSHLSGAIGFTLSLWCAMLTAFLIGSSVFIVLNIDGYKPTTFVIKNLMSPSGMVEIPRLQAKKSLFMSLCDVIGQVHIPKQI